MFEGFSPEALDLLRRLPEFDTAEFAERRPTYRRHLQAPLKAFVEALGPALRQRVSPELAFEAKTHRSIAPINNDLRFRPDAPPYKDHVLLRFWEGRDRKTAPTLYVRLTADEVGFATGATGDVQRWRAAVDAHGAALAAGVEALRDATGGTIAGDPLKRVPRGYAADHPQGDLLRLRWIQVRWARPLPPSVATAEFVAYCADELAHAAPVHHWLVRRLEGGS